MSEENAESAATTIKMPTAEDIAQADAFKEKANEYFKSRFINF